jgi:hypothetical protein
MLAVGLTLWTVLGQTAYYFNRNPLQLGLAVGSACLLDFLLLAFSTHQLSVPLSAYITALSVGLLVESYDWRGWHPPLSGNPVFDVLRLVSSLRVVAFNPCGGPAERCHGKRVWRTLKMRLHSR